ncbi:protein dispatched-like isoform X3 [Artemia franciscana]
MVKKRRRKPKKKPNSKSSNHVVSRALRTTDDRNSTWGRMVAAPDNNSESVGEISKEIWRDLLHFRNFGFNTENREEEEYFCDVPRLDYSHVILEKKTSMETILSLGSLKEICFLDNSLRSQSVFHDHCITPHQTDTCCKSWHLANYLAFFVGKESCDNLTENDLELFQDILSRCFKAPDTADCSADDDIGCMRSLCPSAIAIEHIKDFLIDAQSLRNVKEHLGHIVIHYTGIYLPMGKSSSLTTYYDHLTIPKLNTLEVVAYDFGIKFEVFNAQLKQDLNLLLIGGALVGLCIFLFFQSIFATVSVLLSVVISLGMAYFFYFFVFKIRSFPFVNVLALVIALGIGVDDAFVYFHHWQRAKLQLDGSPLAAVVAKALGTTAVSMFVTSLTTSAACFASYLSDVTALKAFGVFTGTAILFNYFIVVTWLPATIAVIEKFPRVISKFKVPNIFTLFQKLQVPVFFMYFNLFSYCLIIFFLGLSVLSAYFVFYDPKLTLPTEKDFKLFENYHPFERYTDLKTKFLAGVSKEETIVLPLRFVFGVSPIDNGNFLDPLSSGNLVLKEEFNASSEAVQIWVLDFCRKLRRQNFTDLTNTQIYKNCFMDSLLAFMERPCLDPVTGTDRSPCCQNSTFPYLPQVFDFCLAESAKVTILPMFNTGFIHAGPRFRRKDKKLVAFIIEYDSIYNFTSSFVEMDTFYNQVENWFTNEIQTAPSSFNGFFVSYLEFYDLQLSLSHGTMISVVTTLVICFCILLLCTRNISVSFCAALVTFTIVTTTFATLIKMGWELNVLESASISLAVGLSMDYTLHYSVAWSASDEKSVKSVFKAVGPPIFVAALTTVSPSLVMMYSSVLVYRKIGIFILIITTSSLICSCSFLLPLLRLLSQINFSWSCWSSFVKCFSARKVNSQFYLSVPTECHVLSLNSSSTCINTYPVIASNIEMETLSHI